MNKHEISQESYQKMQDSLYKLQMTIASPKDKEKLTGGISELVASKIRAKAEAEFQSEAIKRVSDETGVDKKLIRQLAQMQYKQNYSEAVAEREEIESIYEQLFKTS
jgi:hypothetical protein